MFAILANTTLFAQNQTNVIDSTSNSTSKEKNISRRRPHIYIVSSEMNIRKRRSRIGTKYKTENSEQNVKTVGFASLNLGSVNFRFGRHKGLLLLVRFRKTQKRQRQCLYRSPSGFCLNRWYAYGKPPPQVMKWIVSEFVKFSIELSDEKLSTK